MDGNTWQVEYEGERPIALAIDVIQRALRADGGATAIVRCGGAGAIWNADGRMRGDVFVVTLTPHDPHEVDPTYYVPEMPIPSRLAKAAF